MGVWARGGTKGRGGTRALAPREALRRGPTEGGERGRQPGFPLEGRQEEWGSSCGPYVSAGEEMIYLVRQAEAGPGTLPTGRERKPRRVKRPGRHHLSGTA